MRNLRNQNAGIGESLLTIKGKVNALADDYTAFCAVTSQQHRNTASLQNDKPINIYVTF